MVTKPSHNLRREHKWLKETATLQEDKEFVFQAIQKHIANKKPKTNSPPITPSRDVYEAGAINLLTSLPGSGSTSTATKQREGTQTLSNDSEWLSYPATSNQYTDIPIGDIPASTSIVSNPRTPAVRKHTVPICFDRPWRVLLSKIAVVEIWIAETILTT